MQNKKLVSLSRDLKSQTWINLLLSYPHVKGYLVGGIVRDAFLNKESKDVDLVFENISLDQIKVLLANHGNIIENNVGESFRVLKFKPHGWEGELFDIATPRKDVKVGKGHQGFEALEASDIMEDLHRRDFTINSMAFELRGEKLIDPFNGLKDLSAKSIEATDLDVFAEDPLRIMRAIQFASRFNFSISKSTLKLMKQNADGLKEISGERILDEFQKMFKKNGDLNLALRLMEKTKVIPGLGLWAESYDFSKYNVQDDLSFFFVLSHETGLMGSSFYTGRLKGDGKTSDELFSLDELMKMNFDRNNQESLRFRIFKIFQKTPGVFRAGILPRWIKEFHLEIEKGLIPSSPQDIPVNGNDLQNLLGIEGKKIGEVKEKMQKDALMHRVRWWRRDKVLEQVKTYT